MADNMADVLGGNVTTETLTLADFLLARITEDEAGARAASPGPWTSRDEDGFFSYGDYGWYIVGPAGSPEVDDSEQGKADLDHIARHDPARVLAQCEANRRIVEEHRPVLPDVGRCSHPGCEEHHGKRPPITCSTCGSMYIQDPPAGMILCETLCLLALPYADHPDFRDEWRV